MEAKENLPFIPRLTKEKPIISLQQILQDPGTPRTPGLMPISLVKKNQKLL